MVLMVKRSLVKKQETRKYMGFLGVEHQVIYVLPFVERDILISGIKKLKMSRKELDMELKPLHAVLLVQMEPALPED